MKKDSKYDQCVGLFCLIKEELNALSGKESNMVKLKNGIKSGLRSNALSVIPKKVWFIFSFMVLFNGGCSKAQPVIETFTIKKGDHYSYHAHKVVGNTIKYDVLFEPSCAYNLGNANQYDVNKLFGFNACNSLHHENSARFGWVYLDGIIEIYAYVYENGVRDIEQIATVNINEWNSFELINTGASYAFKVNNTLYIWDKENPCVTKYNYMLYPYFGGDEVAPHDIHIQFKSL